MPSLITAHDLSFEFSNGHVLFQNFNFSLTSQITALVGPNGVGKTCLAQLLANELPPSQGTIHRHQPVTLFAQSQTPPNITVDEYLLQREEEWSFTRERLLQSIDRQTSCVLLSGGEWMRVRLAFCLAEEFLILDEPTNNLDREGRDILLDFIKQHRGGVLLISHDRECLQLCEDVLELSNQGLSKFGGGWSAYLEARQHDREKLQDHLQTSKHHREAIIVDRQVQAERQDKRNRHGAVQAARGGMPKILIGARKRRAQISTGNIDVATFEKAEAAVQKAFAAFSEVKIDPVMYAEFRGKKIPNQKIVAEATNFNIKFNNWLFSENLNFVWQGSIRIALKGVNGSGKSTLLRVLQGEELQTRGSLKHGALSTLFIDQACSTLDNDKTIFQNMRAVCTLSETEIRNTLAKFLFTKENVFQHVATLSGGERLRAALALGFLSTPNPELLILDEPTNNVDMHNIEFLESLIREFEGALIVISHDEIFLENCGIKKELKLL